MKSTIRRGHWAAGLALAMLMLSSCTTTFIEFKGECVVQQWAFMTFNVRRRMLCDLPPPSADEGHLRDREAMSVNPYPNLLDFDNDADTTDPNLLEKKMGVPPDEGDEE